MNNNLNLMLSAIISSKTPFVLSPITPESSVNLHQRLETILKEILVWHEKWHAAHRRGISLCSSIEAIKRRVIDQKEKDKNTDLYPIEELQIYCNNLAVIMTIFEDVISNVKFYEKQLLALVQTDETRILFKSWQIRRFLDVIQKVSIAYEMEYKIKTIVKGKRSLKEPKFEFLSLYFRSNV